ncbi:MAG: gamma-glutamyltransferase [Chloroflexota bacterium]
MPTALNTAWRIQKTEAVAERGMVTSMHPLASAAGVEMLRAGGNAVDAAVATAFAIGVVEPFMSGLGGVAAMVYHQRATGKTMVVDGSSTAPSEARADMFELAPATEQAGMYGWRATLNDAANTGYRAPITPGTPACLLECLARYGSGRLSRSQVLAPAIRLADEGFGVDGYMASTTAFAMRRLRAFPETMRTYFQEDGTPYTPATMTKQPDVLRQPDLARTLRALADHGADAYYMGETAERIVRHVRANGGVLNLGDFRDYRVRVHDAPLAASYRGHTLHGLPELSGCITAYQALGMLERFDLAAMGAGSADATHVIAEALRRAFVDRFAHLADPRFTQVPFAGLLSAEYAGERAATIDTQHARRDVAAGDPWRFQAGSGGRALAAAGAGGEGCTTHLTVVDAERNVASLTSTLGELFGSGVVAEGTGVCLNNGMTWFDPEPGRINSIAPGKRILWAPTPTVVLRDGQPVLGIGAPGGRRIMSAIVQSIVNVLDFKLGIQDAVTAPRVHCEGPTTLADTRLAPETRATLRERGHALQEIPDDASAFSFARPNGILIQRNELRGGVNQHTPAAGIGY